MPRSASPGSWRSAAGDPRMTDARRSIAFQSIVFAVEARRVPDILLEHDLVRKPVPTFRDHALFLEHDLVRKPVPTFRDHALFLEHDRVRKPVPTFRDHALAVVLVADDFPAA